MKNDPDLLQALRRLSATLPREAGPVLEQRVLAAFRARSKSRARSRTYWALAACLALACAWSWAHHPWRPSQPGPAVADQYGGAFANFIALPYAQSDVPLEQAVIVRVRLQSSEWGALGVPIPPPKASGAINADLLIGQDGVARAVRFVSSQ